VPKLNPMVTEDKMCRSKRQYHSVDEAQRVFDSIRPKPKLPLYVYECPFCHWFHLTKHKKPIDPTLKDRVNIELKETT
jgi:hypothetical protein